MHHRKLAISALVLACSFMTACTDEQDATNHAGQNQQAKSSAAVGPLGNDKSAVAKVDSNRGKSGDLNEETDHEAKNDDSGKSGINGTQDNKATGGKDGKSTNGYDPAMDQGDEAKVGKSGKPGSSQTPGQTPVQTPGQTPVQTPPPVNGGVDNYPPMDDPDVVVDLPEEACYYNDAEMQAYVIKKNQFGPNLPPIDVRSSVIDGGMQQDNETFIGFFTLYQTSITPPVFMDRWDGRAGRIPWDYTLVVTNSSHATCTAFLKFVKQNPRTLNGCFDINTKIRMEDGKDMVIAALTEGDKVWNPVMKKSMRISEVIRGKELKSMFEIGFAGKKMIVTENHPMPTKDGIKTAKAVTTSDYLYDENGIIHRVTMAKELAQNPEQMVVNIRLDSEGDADAEHMVLADGMITGDLFLQRKLQNQMSVVKN